MSENKCLLIERLVMDGWVPFMCVFGEGTLEKSFLLFFCNKPYLLIKVTRLTYAGNVTHSPLPPPILREIYYTPN